jgi:transposase-like protein
MTFEERIPARDVARMIGIQTATLAKWRRLGKGPKGWREMSSTLVTYPAAEVERFVSERRSDRT